MSEKIIQLNEAVIKQELGELVRDSVEKTLNELLDQEADRLTNARRYERNEARTDTRAGSYKRKLLTRAGEVTLKVPKLRTLTFETAIIQRYQKREITLAYMDFPREHWTKIHSNNAIERLNREIGRRTRVVGTFPDGHSALMLVCARLRHMEGSRWGTVPYMSMKHLEDREVDALQIG